MRLPAPVFLMRFFRILSRRAIAVSLNMKHSGFTMVELVVVLFIVGVLAAVAAPRFFVKQAYSDRGFYDQTLAITRYAQKSAIALRRNVCVNIASPSINLTYASAAAGSCSVAVCGSTAFTCSACDTALPSPVAGPIAGLAFTISAPSGVTLSSSSPTIIFTALGSVSSASATTTITVSSRTITVETGTGYVHP